MKRFKPFAAVATAIGLLCVLSASAIAQSGGAICIFTDTQGNDCTGIVDEEAGLFQIHVVYTQGVDIGGVQFLARIPDCMVSATWIADTTPFPTAIGDTQSGLAIGLGSCLASPVHLVTISIFGQGLTTADCAYPITGYPATDLIEVVDCSNNKLQAVGGTTYVNSLLPCNCNATDEPALSVSPTTLDFGNATTALDFDITNTGGGFLTWTVSESIPWLGVSATGGSGNETITAGVDRNQLAPGNYNGVIHVTSNGGSQDVQVSMDVDENPILSLTPYPMDFGTSQTELSFGIINIGNGTLEWNASESAPWLTLDQTSGTGDASVAATVDRTGLLPGSYSTSILVTSNGGDGSKIVLMDVESPEPLLGLSPTSLSFAFDESSLPLSIFNAGSGDLNWTMTPNDPWISVVPSSGTNDQTVDVTVDRTGLSDGTYYGSISVTTNAGNANVPVTMVVITGPVLDVYPSALVYQPTVTTRAFNITNIGVGQLDWSLDADQPWIMIEEPLSGSGDATVTVHVDVDAILESGQTTGHVTVTSNGGTETVLLTFIIPSGGEIGLYADPLGNNCEVIDNIAGPLTLYVVHTQTPGSTASQFWAPKPGCMVGAVWIGDSSPYPTTIGDSQTGVSVAYGSCLSAPIHVLTINYYTQGLNYSCCLYPLLPDPDAISGEIEVVDCLNTKHFLNGSPAMINPNSTCPCGILVDVEDKTWGQIKSLYIDWDTPQWRAKQKR